MYLAGIHLTEQGSPIGGGEIGLFRNGTAIALPVHHSMVLLSYRSHNRDMICLHENTHEKDQTSGFYPAPPDPRGAGFTFFFPYALTTFVQGQLRDLRPGLQDSTAFESTQTPDQRSPQMGSIYARLPDSDDCVHLAISRMVISATHKGDGIGLEILAQLKSIGRGPWAGKRVDLNYDRDTDYRLDISCTINRETSEFRYGGGIPQDNTASGLTRHYPGNEVQTDLANLNLKHPLVYNTGGLYALGSEGVHALQLEGPTRIQPVKLRGWGWGSVYDGDTIAGRDELTLPFLTKPLLEHYVDAMGVFEDDTLKSTLGMRGAGCGFYVEDATAQWLDAGAPALNRRDIEAIDINFSLDRFGLMMAIDARLSRVKEASRNDAHKPVQGPRYTKSLMLPWEVLICRGFHLPKFVRHWYEKKSTTPAAPGTRFSAGLTAGMRAMVAGRPKQLPHRLSHRKNLTVSRTR